MEPLARRPRSAPGRHQIGAHEFVRSSLHSIGQSEIDSAGRLSHEPRRKSEAYGWAGGRIAWKKRRNSEELRRRRTPRNYEK